ncbi:MAG: electron transporter RnfD [Betaproteobacteria bacterium HGW-Betaproteobacteria-13]|uniref:Ion-translocating oxidoreductase complex subunit D n=1 Tax=Parazoarcus communis TaxID=41977 RepID=A0A2U8GPR7_9RHOO|nr:RnfABCDGE type electron transport complex subunit D [Parazoarcus communis]AWI75601.1 electron transporter RnfD [Parazoarcus communis]PKO57388.1 MAG: electron transporter RnfD [Betaproteobacteria bacterium HGW-Betaproteobacteria-19]PKO79904.1 MAG: electron transporter RnfD [Betaproteobacteria bacterium HGW-Betaproteobacteria-13]
MNPISSPHAHGARSVGRVMLLVMLALTPATVAGFWHFGWPAITLWCVTILSALISEAFCARLAERPAGPLLADGSAMLTGWLLALSLPPWAPWWIAAAGASFAVIVAKHAFGGLGQNLFNPAMAARVMLLISFPVEMTQWVAPHAAGLSAGLDPMTALSVTFGGNVPDAMTSASLLGHVKSEASRGIALSQSLTGHWDPFSFGLGQRAGSLGETSALLLAAGGVFLMLKRVIGVQIPAAFILGVVLPAAFAHLLAPDQYLPPLAHLLTGGVMLGAFFIATDYVSSPSTPLGQWIFGLGCGLLTWVIRTWGAYPEGVAFAVLLMNSAVPLIDRVTRPRIFGRRRNGHSMTAP